MIIGLVGRKSSGKSTIANYLITHYDFIEYSIASPLKEIAKILGFSHKSVYGSEEDKMKLHPEYGITARTFLQKFGTEVCRDYLPTVLPEMNMGSHGIIWLHLLEKFIHSHPNKNIVISDVRFEDEATTILKQNNSFLIYVERKNVVRNDIHISEQILIEMIPSYTINNDSTYESLYHQIDNIIKKKNDMMYV